jgi:stage IV sporulation protein B
MINMKNIKKAAFRRAHKKSKKLSLFGKLWRAVFGAAAAGMITLNVLIGICAAGLPDYVYCESAGDAAEMAFYSALPVSVSPKADSIAVTAGVGNQQSYQSTFNLFGLFPVKDVKTRIAERPNLVPCGSPFGIKILTDGVIVTDYGIINGVSPAKDAGILIGDNILKVNGTEITNNSDIARAVQKDCDKAMVELLRNGQNMTIIVDPIVSDDDRLLKIGVWVRDSTAGIGTITYYDPKRQVFAGLGHAVCDADTGQTLPLSEGEAVSVTISNIIKSRPGLPGELGGAFLSSVPIGNITGNLECGVFGKMNYVLTQNAPIPMAFKQEVKLGPAVIYTTIAGTAPECYDVIIEQLDYNESSKVKNMVVRVADGDLLRETGGIVQGMSGSPIIQNGMLVGAVTHVFVSDCTRGYAIFAENMYTGYEALAANLQDAA